MLNEMSQSQKDKCAIFYLYEILGIVRISKTESTMCLPGARGGENGELLFSRYRVQFYKMKRIMGMADCDDCISV